MGEPARRALAASDSIALHSERFGDYAVPAERVYSFAEGLIGFREARRFVLLEPDRATSLFRCLVCVDSPELGFVVCDPTTLWPDYVTDLPPLVGTSAEDLSVLAIVTVPRNPREVTVNLMAPLLIDSRARTGRQLVLDTGRYSTRHALLSPAADACA